MEFAEQGGEGPTPYEVLLHAAMVGNSTRFTRQDNIEETWRICGPLLEKPPRIAAVQARHLGTKGRRPAGEGVRRVARAVDRVMSPAKQKGTGKKTRSSGKAAASGDGKTPAAGKEQANASERRDAVAVPSDRRLRLPLQLPYRRTGRARRSDRAGSASRASTRPASSGHCSTARPVPSASGPSGSTSRAPGSTSPGRTSSTPPGTPRAAGHSSGTRSPSDPTQHKDEVTPHTRAPADEDAHHLLVRTVLCMEGSVDMELLCEPDFDYGRTPADWCLEGDHTADASGAGVTVRLRSSMPLGVEGQVAQARHTLQKGEQAFCSLSWAEELASPEDMDQANARMSETANYWRTWVSKARMPDHRFRGAIQRSALAIKGLTYMPTGATVAALTTSLPETPGGERNWDYRFTWIRDSTFTLQALHYLNLDWEANEFMQFVGDLEPDEDGALQIMYGIDGRRDLTETTRDDLSGYAGASPVRVGNGAFDQRQNDVFGAALDSILLHSQPEPAAAPRALAGRRGAGRVRDAGLEEARPGDLGGARQAPAIRLLQADVLGRDGPGLEARGDPGELEAPGELGRHGRGDPQGHPRQRRPGRRPAAALRHRRPRRLDPAGCPVRLPPGRRRGAPQERAGNRGRPHRGRVRAALRDRRDRRRALGQGGQLPDLLLLARLGSGDHSRAAARARPDGPAAPHRLPARPLRRGVRPQHGPPPGELPPGLLPPRPDRGGGADHPQRAPQGGRRRAHERLRRDRDRQRRRRRDAGPPARPLRQEDPAAGAGRLAARESRRTGSPRTSSSTAATSRRTPGTTTRTSRSRRRSTTSSAGRPSCTAPRSTACAPRTSARSSTTTASLPPGRSPTRRWSPTTRRPSSSTRCTGHEERTRPSRRQARSIPSRPSRHEPRIQQLCRRPRRRRLPARSTRPAA